MYWLGVDVGGTFTDAVLYDGRALHYGKAPSTPGDPARGVLAAVELLGADLSRVERFVHGVTIATNAILERRGAEVWLLTTEGFRDVLEIARTNRPVLYDIKSLKTPPLVPRTRALEVRERLMFDGSVRVPLKEKEVRSALAQMPRKPPPTGAALAVCFLHSYANPAHEQAAARIAAKALPGWFVCASAEVLPQFREYERFNTTALNAYVGPLMARYLERLRGELAARGYRGPVFIMNSNGGVGSVERAKRLPVSTVLSGPAGGVAAARHLGARLAIGNQITCDMGGTSTDVCLIHEGQVPVTNEQYIGEYANRTSQIEINVVGAGGGSIAWLDAGDILMVGPQSAGAEPGPACYGQGGTEPTVTDANLVLGRLSAGNPLGGSIALDEQPARAALEQLRRRLPEMDGQKLDVAGLAEGIVRIAVARMVSAIKQISIAKGHDPRDFTLVAYGGAGPMHAALIADELEIRRVAIPAAPGNFAAFGSLISDLRRDYMRTRPLQPRKVAFREIRAVFAEMMKEGSRNLRAEGVAARDIRAVRALGMRYLGQSWELEVPLPGNITSVAQLERTFHEVHERRFGHRSGEPTEIVTFHLAAIGQVAKPVLPRARGGPSLAAARLERRKVYFAGRHRETPVYQRSLLPLSSRAGAGGGKDQGSSRGPALMGPAIIEESGATTVVPPGWRAVALNSGDLLLERR